MLLEGRVAIVTGAARGIGLAAAERLAAEGASVLAVDLDLPEAERAAVSLQARGLRVQVHGADVSQLEGATAMVRAAEERFGKVDILVNNAGIVGPTSPIERVDEGEWDRVMSVDLKSVFLCSRAVIPGMKARGYGRIVNVASIAGKEGNPNMTPYSAAKAGVIGFTKSLGKEVAHLGICVNAISPAVIDTPLLRQVPPEQARYMIDRIPMGRMGRPEEVAALIAWLSSDECSFTTGQCLDISGGRATY